MEGRFEEEKEKVLAQKRQSIRACFEHG